MLLGERVFKAKGMAKVRVNKQSSEWTYPQNLDGTGGLSATHRLVLGTLPDFTVACCQSATD
jgi:hypothetical protein